MSDAKVWIVSVWDGNSSYSFERYGTYQQVVNTLAGYPPAYIWSVN